MKNDKNPPLYSITSFSFSGPEKCIFNVYILLILHFNIINVFLHGVNSLRIDTKDQL